MKKLLCMILAVVTVATITCTQAFAADESNYIDRCYKPTISDDDTITTTTDEQGRTVITWYQEHFDKTVVFTFNEDGTVIVDQDGHTYYFRGAKLIDGDGNTIMDTSSNVEKKNQNNTSASDSASSSTASNDGYDSIRKAFNATDAEIEQLKESDAKAFISGYRDSSESTGIIGDSGTNPFGNWYSDPANIGDSIQWSLKDGVLTLTGFGDTTYTSVSVGTFISLGGGSDTRKFSTSPFNGNRYIKTVVIDGDIDDINNLIGYLPNLETIILLGNTDYSITHTPNLKNVIVGANLITKIGESRPTGATHYSNKGHASFDIDCLMLTNRLSTEQYLQEYDGKEPNETFDARVRTHLNNTNLIEGTRIVCSTRREAVEKTWAAFDNYYTQDEMIAKAKVIIEAANLTDEALALLPDELGGTGGIYDPLANFTVSTWATNSVRDAFALDIIPDEACGTKHDNLGADYTATITRGQFAELAVELYETVTGTTLSYFGEPHTIFSEYGEWTKDGFVTGVREKTIRANYSHFADSNSGNHLHAEAMGKMYGLGVITGYNSAESVYDVYLGPDDLITREQAATLLTRLAEKLGVSMSVVDTPFTDSPSAWAAEGVAKMYSIGVMSGTSSTTFSPKASYTTEQSIVTMLRLYELVK